ncbi:MAG TPA: DinB family protein [Candidatus Acidoferrales bacterium]|nr:DinB family protein [Candidatus Acidoferrales bacterium]
MPAGLSFNDLMDYTDWERRKWHERLRQRGDEVLKISAGPNGDGRFSTVGHVIKHIFSAEKRYIDRLSNRPLTDPAGVPANSIEVLFEFGRQSRNDLKHFIESLPAQQWDAFTEFDFLGGVLRATPRKIISHVLLHETRHWAQIATLFRLNGLTGEFHDFIFSPVLDGEFVRSQTKVGE